MRRRESPGWTTVALGVAGGFLVGVLLVVVLGGVSGSSKTRTVTVARTLAAQAPPTPTSTSTSPDQTVVRLTPVPDVTGERLDIAEDRIKRSGFLPEHHGGGLFGVVVKSHWDVAEQTPAAGALREQGSTVSVQVTRR